MIFRSSPNTVRAIATGRGETDRKCDKYGEKEKRIQEFGGET